MNVLKEYVMQEVKKLITLDSIKNATIEKLKEYAQQTYNLVISGQLDNDTYDTIKKSIEERAEELNISEDLKAVFEFQENAFSDYIYTAKFIAKPASDFEDEETDFVWYPYIPRGEYTVLMADGGTGKTTFCCGIAAAISNGQRLPGMVADDEPVTGNILIITGEDRGGQLKIQLKNCNADLSKIYILDCMDSEGLNFTQGCDIFQETIKRYAPELVIIDPWHCFLGSDIDINRVNAVRPVFQKLANIAKNCNCGMILISHVNKRAQGENANNAATGSSDFINAARSAIKLIFSGEPGEDNIRIAVHTKSNHAAPGQSIKFKITMQKGLEWTGFSDITRSTLEEAARHKKTPSEMVMQNRLAEQTNQALIDAIVEKAEAGKRINISYDQFKEEYGKEIFETPMPKKELDKIADKLERFKISVTTGKTVGWQNKTRNGFEIYKIL